MPARKPTQNDGIKTDSVNALRSQLQKSWENIGCKFQVALRQPLPISAVPIFPIKIPGEEIWASVNEFVFSSPVAPAAQMLTSQG
jgi:hypothetical protein